MKKRKILAYEALNAKFNYDLGQEKLTFTHMDLIFSNSHIPLSISHEYQINQTNNGYGKGFKLNLEKELVKVDTDTYKLVLPNGVEETFDELYYIKNNNIREYISKSDIEVLPDGSLEYNNQKVYKELKNNKGISLSGDYTTFINCNEYNFKQEELTQIEQEILQLKQGIYELNHTLDEMKKYDEEIVDGSYRALLEKQLEYENKQLLYAEQQKNNISTMNSLYSKKNEQYNYLIKQKVEKYSSELLLNYGVGGMKFSNNTYTFDENLVRYAYKNNDGFLAEKYSLLAKYQDTAGETSALEQMSENAKKADYYSQVFQDELEKINQLINQYSNTLENSNWSKQKELIPAEYEYLFQKQEYEKKYRAAQNEYYSKMVPLYEEQLSLYQKMLNSKEYEKEELLKIIPSMYLSSNDGLVYGFNESGKLCVIFDAFEHQIVIQYNDFNRIKNVIDEKGNSINFIYNDSNNLIKIYESQGNYISYEYDENEFLIKIIYSDDNVSTLEYNSGYLYKYIDVNKQGYYIQYMSGEITQIRDLFIKSDNSQFNDHIDYFTYDGCHVSVSNNKNDMLNNYIFDEKKYIVTEYNTIDGEIDSISMHENHDKCCSFDMTYNKTHQKQVLASSLTLDSGNSRKVGYTVDLFNDYSTDYILYAFADGNAILPYQRHKTKYCNVTSSIGWVTSRFELSCIIKYDGLDDVEYAVSFNKSISGKQFAALPITLEEDETGKLIKPTSITVYADFSGNTTSCEITDFTLTLGDYVYSEYNEAYNKTSDYYSEAVTPKTVMGEKQGYYLNKRKIDYTYNYNELLESQVEAIYYEEYDLSSNLVSSDTKITTKSYKYNSNNKIAKEEDSKGNIVEYLYNDQGLCIMKKSYYKSLPNEAYIEECEYDENGKLIKEANSLGYNEEYKYINESNKLITTPNGNILNINSTNNCDSISAEADGIDNYNNSVYELSRLIEYNTEGMKYSYTYDEYGREKELYINDKLYSTFSYLETSSTISYKTLYPNNSGFEKITDKYGNTLRINKITSNTTIEYIKYELDSLDRVIKETENINGNEYITIYNYIDNTLASIQTNDYTKTTNYDMYNKELETTYQINNNQIKYKSEYNDDILNKYSVLYNNEVLYQEQLKLDKLNRLVNNTNTLLSDNYTYLSKNGRATNLISLNQKNINGNIQRYKYSYDKEGNIISKIENHSNTRYTYDSLNRLIREDNKSFNKTYIYTYDSNGNILSKGIYDYSLDDILENEEIIRYNYNDFNDYLTNYNGEEIEYDSIGNPIIYRNKILCWDQRNLISYDNCSYTYNNHNIRTSKYTGNKKIDYILDGKTILKEIITNYTTYLYLDEALNNLETVTESTEEIEYIYSKSGVIGFKYNNELYYYNKNILGDILEIYDSKYNLVAKYEYDAWGNHNIVVNINNIANINPFRYRSYYYDSETNLYYLQSRYYDPQTHRFINMDSIEYLDPENINGLNLFAYCGNNPVVRVDYNGNAWWDNWWKGLIAIGVAVVAVVAIAAITVATGGSAAIVFIGAGIGAATSLAVSAGTQLAFTGKIDLGQLLLDVAVGAIMGAFGGTGLHAGVLTPIGGFVEAGASLASDAMAGEKLNIGKAMVAGAFGALFSAIGGHGAQKGLIKPRRAAIKNMKLATKNYKMGKYTLQGYQDAMNSFSKRYVKTTVNLKIMGTKALYEGVYTTLITSILGAAI